RHSGNKFTEKDISDDVVSRLTVREKVSTGMDLPLSKESKRILAYAAEEAELLRHRYIGVEHLMLGMLREERCLAADVLSKYGLTLSGVREHLAQAATLPEETAPMKRTIKYTLGNILEQHGARRSFVDLSHTIEHGMITYKGLPAPLICD